MNSKVNLRIEHYVKGVSGIIINETIELLFKNIDKFDKDNKERIMLFNTIEIFGQYQNDTVAILKQNDNGDYLIDVFYPYDDGYEFSFKITQEQFKEIEKCFIGKK